MSNRLIVMAVLLCGSTAFLNAEEKELGPEATAPRAALNQSEAFARARMLHEMVRGTLQIMHRDFFDEENAHAIPSASLEDVFHEMEKTHHVKMKWLVVNTDLVNVDHEAETAFEKSAVKNLAAGKPFAEDITAGVYHFAGPIRLGSQCLKCHVKRRTNNEDRTAGLVITMPIDGETGDDAQP